jgi:protein-tyrosine phosphatase
MTHAPARRLDLQGAANFRDLGGYPLAEGRRTRWRVLWRSDALSDLTDEDFAALAPLGLRLVIDFRLPLERARRPNRLPPVHDIETVHIGFLPDGATETLRQAARGALAPDAVARDVVLQYRALPVRHTREYAEMFDRLERVAGAPAVIHCTSGKDRTGFGAAMILLALGASRDVALADYLLTNEYRRDIRALFRTPPPPEVLDMLTRVRPQYLQAAFDAIDEAYGSTEAYLQRGLGLTAARRARLRAWLSEPAN